jgi:FAD/FMN-containing dehydrogenase
MTEVSVRSSEGGVERLDAGVLEAFGSELRGELLLPGGDGYERARTVWNAMIDRRPALVARCAGVSDVIRSVELAREHGLLVSVKGAGHNIAGKAICDGGLLIDLSGLRGVRVDPGARTAQVDPGATLADVDHETQAFALATPLGINSTTGVSGLILGGGFGWLSRKYGLTVDNLRAADVVTADGRFVRASDRDEAELFWGLRGGGGNFGVVTSYELALHPVGPEVLSGLIVHRLADAETVLSRYREVAAAAPEELSCWVVVRKAPPLPFIPPEMHGQDAVIFALMYAGELARARDAVQPLRDIGRPVAEHIVPHPYEAWQQAFDPLLTPGARNYWKSNNFTTIADGLIERMRDFGGRLPSPHTEIFLAQVGGAASRPAPDATAYPHRDAAFIMNVHTRWTDSADDERCVAWAREFHEAVGEFATGGVYVNFVSEGEQRVADAFGQNYRRLARLKRRLDPDNLFRSTQNIAPEPDA